MILEIIKSMKCNTTMKSELTSQNILLVASENCKDSLKIEMLSVKNNLAKARVKSANMR